MPGHCGDTANYFKYHAGASALAVVSSLVSMSHRAQIFVAQVRCAEVFDSSEGFQGDQCTHLCIQGLAATSIRLFMVSQIADAAFAQQRPLSRSRNEMSSVSVS